MKCGKSLCLTGTILLKGFATWLSSTLSVFHGRVAHVFAMRIGTAASSSGTVHKCYGRVRVSFSVAGAVFAEVKSCVECRFSWQVQ